MDEVISRICDIKVIAILRRMPPEAVLPVANALVDGGVRAIEVTFGSEGTREAIAAVRQHFGEKALIGAGTVMSPADVDTAREAGAQFLLSPHFDRKLVEYAQARDMLFVPGVTTPTEIAQAVDAGCQLLKLFPAGSLGPGYLKDLKGPFRHVQFMPTGGIGKDNGREFFRAGAVALGMGGLLVNADYVSRQDYQGLSDHVRQVLQAVAL